VIFITWVILQIILIKIIGIDMVKLRLQLFSELKQIIFLSIVTNINTVLRLPIIAFICEVLCLSKIDFFLVLMCKLRYRRKIIIWIWILV